MFSHLDGICHTYIDKFANKEMAINITFNAKMRRTSICGATETILCHKKAVKDILPFLIKKLIKNNCIVKGDNNVKKINQKVISVKKEDWEQLGVLANKTNRTRSTMIGRLIRFFMDNKGVKANGKTNKNST